MANPKNTLKLGWFSTGAGEGSQGLLLSALEAIESGVLNAEIEFIFCNREPTEDPATDSFIEIVSNHDIPVISLSSRQFAKERQARFADVRQEYDDAVLSRLSDFTAEICVLAGYMLVLSTSICHKYRLLNLHPAKPSGPIGTWRDVIDTLIRDRATESGIMMHLATEEVDRGPVVSYCTFPIRDKHTEQYWSLLDSVEPHENRLDFINGVKSNLFKLIRSMQLRYERPFFVETLRALANQRISDTNMPQDLTNEVNRSIPQQDGNLSSH